MQQANGFDKRMEGNFPAYTQGIINLKGVEFSK